MSRWEASETGIAERAAARQIGCFRGLAAGMKSSLGAAGSPRKICEVSNSGSVVRRVSRGDAKRVGAGSRTWHEMRSQIIKEKRRCDS